MKIIQYSIGSPINLQRAKHMGVSKIYVVGPKPAPNEKTPILKAPVSNGPYNCVLKRIIGYIVKVNRSDDLLIMHSEVYIPALSNIYLGSTIALLAIPIFDDIIYPIYIPREKREEFLNGLSKYKCKERLDKYISEYFKPVPIILPPVSIARNIMKISGIDVILW